MIDSNNLEHQLGLNLPSDSDRLIRATKFPRIGRASSLDSDELTLIDDVTLDEHDDNENEYRWLEQRSVLFPRIGKRAFHNIVWGNSLANPHRMLDAQGRYQIDGYGYHHHSNPLQSIKPFRGKRNTSM